MRLDCAEFDMRAAAPEIAKLGMGYCRSIPIVKGEFVTATYARECERFKPAAEATVAKRRAILEPKKETT